MVNKYSISSIVEEKDNRGVREGVLQKTSSY